MDNQKKESNIFDDFNNLLDHFNKLKEKKGFKTFLGVILIVVFGIVIEWMNSNGDMMIFFAGALIVFIVTYISRKVSPVFGAIMAIISLFALLYIGMRGTYDTVMSKKNKSDNESFREYATGEKIITKVYNKHKENEENRGEKVDTELTKGETGNFDGAFEIYAESKEEQKMIIYKKDSIDVTVDKKDQKRREWMEPKKGIETVRNDQQAEYQKQIPISIQGSLAGTKETVWFDTEGPKEETSIVCLSPGQRVRIRCSEDCIIGTNSDYFLEKSSNWKQVVQDEVGKLQVRGKEKPGKLEIEVL